MVYTRGETQFHDPIVSKRYIIEIRLIFNAHHAVGARRVRGPLLYDCHQSHIGQIDERHFGGIQLSRGYAIQLILLHHAAKQGEHLLGPFDP